MLKQLRFRYGAIYNVPRVFCVDCDEGHWICEADHQFVGIFLDAEDNGQEQLTFDIPGASHNPSGSGCAWTLDRKAVEALNEGRERE